MFITNTRTSFHLPWKKKLVKHQKFSNYNEIENGCRVASSADIIKIRTMLIKATFKDSQSSNYVLKCNL